ncbi:hypothetical protein EKO04_001892 [Ascochyta lentis]|uniref:Uncharacterized protein n=1 Tax=Ascochyta lentis TaxID=205686 RepID=A0A8H7JC35_9PLEO|nr:hypothetical protein EKO04_001892 [Ascochyta lentis]
MTTSTASLVSSDSSGSNNNKNDDIYHSPSLKLKPSTPKLRIPRPRIHMPWPRKRSFIKLPKDAEQLDATPLYFNSDTDAGGNVNTCSDGRVEIDLNVDVDADTTPIQPRTPRHLNKIEREVRVREAKVGKREDDVRTREKKVWEGLKEVARGKVHVAVLEARVRELEGTVGGGGKRRGGGKAGCERGTRQWWVKGWWSLSDGNGRGS